MIVAIFGGSAIAGCCGGPFSANADDGGGCDPDSPDRCPHVTDAGSPADASADACLVDAADAG
jgi:hypothetical protein